jgi:uncharacterized protein YfdQ (DUF2303 family)
MVESHFNPSVELAQHLAAVDRIEITSIGNGVLAAAVPLGRKLVSIKGLRDEYLLKPERKRGTATVNSLMSFIELVNRGADEGSVLFARRDPAAMFEGKPTLTAVLNYNPVGPRTVDAAFGDHRIVYPFPLSEEFKVWTGKNGTKLSQAEFAEFLENRIADVIAPEVTEGDAISDLGKLLGGSFAGPARLMELSRGMTISAEMRVKQAVNLGTGEATIQYEEEYQDGAGQPVKVPSLFVIAIPIFEDGNLYRIGVRLRYRLAGGKVVWFYELYRADKSFKHAFDEACVHAAAETGLSLFYGTPEV